jgi:hypothetical protein
MEDIEPTWMLVEFLLPYPGAIVDFYCDNVRSMLSGPFGNGGFSDIRSGDFYNPMHVLRWRDTSWAEGPDRTLASVHRRT